MTEGYSFNLLMQPWLPCVRKGEPELLSIRAALAEAHQLDAVAGASPLETASLYRLLLAILHRVFGPADSEVWANLWQAPSFDMAALDSYLSQWIDHFDLFSTVCPFYQRDEQRVDSKSVINMLLERASGNNATLFDHSTEETGATLTPAEAARALVTIQTFGLGGACHPQKKLTFTDAPAASAILFLVEGKSLKETLLLNMPDYSASDEAPLPTQWYDAPAWELEDPLTPERDQPHGYLDLLTWQTRSIHLHPERNATNEIIVRMVTMAPGLRLASTVRDPMKHHWPHPKLGLLPLKFVEERLLWRDSTSLLGMRAATIDQPLPPAALRSLRLRIQDGALPTNRIYRVSALGMARDQAKVDFFRTERLPLPLAYLETGEMVNQLNSLLEQSEKVARDAIGAMRTMAMTLQLAESDGVHWPQLNSNQKEGIKAWIKHTNAEQIYWTTLDIPFQQLIVTLPNSVEEAGRVWRQTLREAAESAFAHAARFVPGDARGFKAIVRGRGLLHYLISQTLPTEEKELVP